MGNSQIVVGDRRKEVVGCMKTLSYRRPNFPDPSTRKVYRVQELFQKSHVRFITRPAMRDERSEAIEHGDTTECCVTLYK